MSGILYVKMTNPEADCKQVGMGMGRSENIVTVGWKTTAATFVSDGICEIYAASQLSRHGPYSVRPTKFTGRLRQIEVVYPHGPTATPKTNYDMHFHKGNAASFSSKDLAASAFYNVPIAEASLKGTQLKQFNPPLSIDDDIQLRVWNTGATPTLYKSGTVKMYFE